MGTATLRHTSVRDTEGGERGLLKWRRGLQLWVRIPGLEKSGRFSVPRGCRPGFGRRIHPAGAVQGLRAHPSLPVPDRPATLSGLASAARRIIEPAAPRARGRRDWGVSAGLGGSRASNPRRCVWERPDQGISAVTSD